MCQFIETIRIEEGKAVNLAFHNYRFNRTRRDLFACNLPINLADHIHPEQYTERTKCRVAYQEEVEHVDYQSYTLRPVKSLKMVTAEKLDYAYKSSDRQKLNELFRQKGEADDILIIRDGLLTDTSIANIALWNGTQWETPEAPLLAGTMRASLLGKGQIVPAVIRPQDLSRYSLIRVFNAMIGFGEIEIPVGEIR